MLRIVSTLCAALAASLLSFAAVAQYPAKPIRLIPTSGAGGAPDVIARVVGQKMSEGLGQPVVVENRTGANGYVAAEYVSKSPADGYTLLLGADSVFVINPHLYKAASYEVGKDFVAVTSVAYNGLVFVVDPALPVKTLPEFIAYARKANPPLSYGSAGNGSQHHLAMERLKSMAGIELVHVPYKTGAPAAQATMTGEVAATLGGTSASPQIHAGRLRALAVTGRTRLPSMPDLPTIAEFYPGYEMGNWYGLFAPAGTPEPVLARLRAEVAKAMQSPEVREKLKGAGGIDPWLVKPEEFNAVIQADYAKFGKLVKEVGAKVE